MSQTATNTKINGRIAAMARRRAMAKAGKTATKLSPETLVTRENLATNTTNSQVETTTAKTNPRSVASARVTPKLQQSVARTASRERRRAMSTTGKAAIKGSTQNNRTASSSGLPLRGTAARRVAATSQNSQMVETSAVATTVSDQKDCRCSCKGDKRRRKSSSRSAAMRDSAKIRAVAKNTTNQSVGRAASIARRRSMSTRGKAGIGSQGLTPAQTARAANPQLSGRQLAQTLREQRSRRGKAGQQTTESSRRTRRRRSAKSTGSAEDAPWKVGASETTHGQTVTGTVVGRSQKVSGDEQSTCRVITGTEYMGADIFREFCQTEPVVSNLRGGVSETQRGQSVTGNKVGRSDRVTGDEYGSCKQITGDEYVGAEQMEQFCNVRPEPKPQRITSVQTRQGKMVTGNNVGRSDKVTGDEVGSGLQLTGSQYMATIADDVSVPAKVGKTETLRGGLVTGTQVGRSQRVTGDEIGSCRNVTGDDYVGQEQYQQFCEQTPQPQDQKVGQSGTLRGETVTGTMTGRSFHVTGDESGTCKAVTGTPYAGLEQYQAFCGTEQNKAILDRSRPVKSSVGAVMTGLQPGISDSMTGNQKGQCEPLTGTPYVGADQFAEACAAEVNSSDFPQPLAGGSWGEFSVDSPSHATTVQNEAGVTGSRYEKGHITGPFGKASGRVTGTEEFRFGSGEQAVAAVEAPVAEMTEESNEASYRITGEGMAVGNKITGDDWERGNHVTGTEGSSANRRNPTRRGGVMESMAFQQAFKRRNSDNIEVPMSVVTGSSGNTEKGAIVTYSGGARG